VQDCARNFAGKVGDGKKWEFFMDATMLGEFKRRNDEAAAVVSQARATTLLTSHSTGVT
jgi:hypothetical protein